MSKSWREKTRKHRDYDDWDYDDQRRIDINRKNRRKSKRERQFEEENEAYQDPYMANRRHKIDFDR